MYISPEKILKHRHNDYIDKWLVNLTSSPLPTNVVSLLRLGREFSLPPPLNKSTIFELIKDILRTILRN